MLHFLSANWGTILVCAVLIAIVTAVIAVMVRNRKNGKSSCGCGCGNCPSHGTCHPDQKK